MDDLLIVSRSDRFKSRYAQRQGSSMGLGTNLGLLLGIALGLLFRAQAPGPNELLPLALGIGIGVAAGGVLGRFIDPKRQRARRQRPLPLYDGLPFSQEEENKENSSSPIPGDQKPADHR